MARPQKQVVGSKAQNKKKAHQHQKRLAFFTVYKNEQRHEKSHIRRMMKHLASRWGRGDLRAIDQLRAYSVILRSKLGATDEWLAVTRQQIAVHRREV